MVAAESGAPTANVLVGEVYIRYSIQMSLIVGAALLRVVHRRLHAGGREAARDMHVCASTFRTVATGVQIVLYYMSSAAFVPSYVFPSL